ncbi:hypothetical protein [Streptomyces sp. NPDC005017]|uniref:hypothetical protein n=1 Tax=Streptomyces sp. NPDC005017 TaxID=3364706 RepID=UPI0036BB8C0A
MFWFDDGEPGYETWMGVPSMPKPNWSSPQLQQRMTDAPDSVAARWLHTGADSLTFLRELGGERLLIHAVRSGHEPVRLLLPVSAEALYGDAGALRPDGTGHLELPSDGPAFHVRTL